MKTELTHAVICDVKVQHVSSHRGCAIYAGRYGGDVVSKSEADRIEKATAELAELRKREQARDEASEKAVLDDATDLTVREYSVTPPHGYQLLGEAWRAAIALNRHEMNHRSGFCGSLFGGNCHDAIGDQTTTANVFLTPEKRSPQEQAGRLVSYASMVWDGFRLRGDRIGMRRAADLMAAMSVTREIVTW